MKTVFIESMLAKVATALVENKDQFVREFVEFSHDSRFTVENANALVDFLTNPENHKIGSTEIVDGIKVNIDWTSLKQLKDVNPEMHKKFHDIHIPTFNEGMFIIPAGSDMEVVEEFDEKRDIGFYRLPSGESPLLIQEGEWLFVPVNEYHGPLYGGFNNSDDVFFDEDGTKRVVKICVKILAD